MTQLLNVHYLANPIEVLLNLEPLAGADECMPAYINFAAVTESVVHSVYKIVTQSSFGVI